MDIASNINKFSQETFRTQIKHLNTLKNFLKSLILGVVWKVSHFFFWQNKLDFSETLSQIGFNSTIINVLLEHYCYFTPTSLGKCFGCKKTGRRGQKMSTILIDSRVVYFQHFYLYKLKTKTEPKKNIWGVPPRSRVWLEEVSLFLVTSDISPELISCANGLRF